MTESYDFPMEVSFANAQDTFEHYSEMVQGAIDEVSYQGDHPAVQEFDYGEVSGELAEEVGDDIETLLEAGMSEEEAVATSTFWTGVAYADAQNVEGDAGGVAHNTVEVIPERTGVVDINAAMEGQHYFEEGADNYSEVMEEIGVN